MNWVYTKKRLSAGDKNNPGYLNPGPQAYLPVVVNGKGRPLYPIRSLFIAIKCVL
jgi:hypothetical protein